MSPLDQWERPDSVSTFNGAVTDAQVGWPSFGMTYATCHICQTTCVLSCVLLFATPWTVAHQVPLSVRILQARILEWVAMPSSRGSSQPRDQTQVSQIAGGFFAIWATRELQWAELLAELLGEKSRAPWSIDLENNTSHLCFPSYSWRQLRGSI